MSIESKIEELISAINSLNAAIAGKSGGSTPAPSTTPAADAPRRGRPPKSDTTPKAPSVSKAEMQAAVNEVKEAFDTATAKALIKKVGFDKLADVTEAKYKELYDLAKAKMAENDEGDDDEGDDGDM